MNIPAAGHILQSIYDHEVNASISWFWDGGVEWKLGDGQNGYRASGTARTVEQAIGQLVRAVHAHYPEVDLSIKSI